MVSRFAVFALSRNPVHRLVKRLVWIRHLFCQTLLAKSAVKAERKTIRLKNGVNERGHGTAAGKNHQKAQHQKENQQGDQPEFFSDLQILP